MSRTQKQHLLQIVMKHNAIIEAVESLDIKIQASDFLKLSSALSVNLAREGWAIVDAMLDAGITGAKIDAQSGHITLPAKVIFEIMEEEAGGGQ